MSIDHPAISVVLPAYNSGKYLSEAIESILNQTFTDFELIIVDDCSTDGTWDVIKHYSENDKRIVPLRNQINSREAKTLNRGILAARGKYIVRMDHDDWSYPYRLQKQYDFMERHPEVGICGGTMEVCDKDLKIKNLRSYPLSDEAIRKVIFRYSPFCHPAIIMRREVLNKSGLYDHAFYPPDDYDLYFRIGRYSQFANLPETLLKYRVLDKSITNSSTKRLEILTIAIRKKYAREYRMSLFDRAYTTLQYLSIFIIPARMKILIFSFFRDKKI
jgi:glycosyltransferase involved in cell wall biosynthesis